MNYDWKVVSCPEDLPTKTAFKSNPTFYNVLCSGGKMRVAYPFYRDSETPEYWETMTGANGIIFNNEIIGICPIDVPGYLIDEVLKNKRSRTSCFVEMYAGGGKEED